ncbi:DUF1365 domain-containing protein [Kiloniella sp. b19]|uniref:DUF1365 domain-containing protein n=1 Tax=Kiloniella sp. GXU_MW_B19 TaxID=3141326 RepID=UPI0031CE2346
MNPASSFRSSLFTGKVLHHRHSPRKHKLTYRVFSALIDLDELPELDKSLRLFGWNRGALLSFHDRDYGEGRTGKLKERAHRLCREAGISGTPGRVELLCYPRLWGYVFNPLSVYLCYDGGGALVAVIYEVSNTFGQRHSYVFPELSAKSGVLEPHGCRKGFYVSPFMPMEADYAFRLSLPETEHFSPEDRLTLAIAQRCDAGDRLNAVFSGQRVPLNDREIAKTVVGNPAMTFKVMAGIHWEALKLWKKKLPLYPRPEPPLRNYTIVRTPQTVPAVPAVTGKDEIQ